MESIYEAASRIDDVKQALKEVLLSREARDLARALTPAEERYEMANLEILLSLAKSKVYGPGDVPFTSLQDLPIERLFEAANQYQEVKHALLVFHVVEIALERAEAGLPALTPTEERYEKVNLELLLALAKA